MVSVGQIVFSKKGRDKGLPFVIINIIDEYVYLADGKLRSLSKLKKKKLKHVQITNHIDEKIKSMLLNSEYILDSDIRKALLSYIKGVL